MGWISQRDSRNSRVWDGSTRVIEGTAGCGMDQLERQQEQQGVEWINQRDSRNSGAWDGSTRESRNSRAWDGSNREIAGTAGRGMDQTER